MINKEIKIAFEDYQSVDELQPADKALCLEAVKALATSHSPYSKFRVGVAMRLQSGKILYASNQENVAYPSGLCAERVALFHWGANHSDDPIQSIAITAHTDSFELIKPITPCGACLQVLAEYENMQDKAIDVMLYCQKGQVWKTNGFRTNLKTNLFII